MEKQSNSRAQSYAQRDSARHLAMVKARNKRIILLSVSLCLCLVLIAGIWAGLNLLLQEPKDDGKILPILIRRAP